MKYVVVLALAVLGVIELTLRLLAGLLLVASVIGLMVIDGSLLDNLSFDLAKRILSQ